jgi:hypothetical protein
VADTLLNLLAIVKENLFNDVAVVGNLRAAFNNKEIAVVRNLRAAFNNKEIVSKQ